MDPRQLARLADLLSAADTALSSLNLAGADSSRRRFDIADSAFTRAYWIFERERFTPPAVRAAAASLRSALLDARSGQIQGEIAATRGVELSPDIQERWTRANERARALRHELAAHLKSG